MSSNYYSHRAYVNSLKIRELREALYLAKHIKLLIYSGDRMTLFINHKNEQLIFEKEANDA